MKRFLRNIATLLLVVCIGAPVALAASAAPESLDKLSMRAQQIIVGGAKLYKSAYNTGLVFRPVTSYSTTLDTTITAATPSASRAYTLPDAGGSASLVLLSSGQSVAGALSRADMATTAGSTIRNGILSCKNLAGTTITGSAGAGVFGISTTATFGSPAQLSLVTEVANSNTKTDAMEFEVLLPPNYVAGSAISVDIGQKITIGAGTLSTKSLTVDAFKVATDGTVGSNLGPAAQNMTNGGGVLSFAITPTGLVAGDKLLVQVQTVLTETGASNVTANLNSVNVTTTTQM